MEIKSRIYDKRINCENVLVEMKIGEYLLFAQKIIDNNEFQRSKVKSSKSIYSMLKNDLTIGCVMPSIVLAIDDENVADLNQDSKIIEYIQQKAETMLILDGLQRTYTLIDTAKDAMKNNNNDFFESIIRVEVYISITKFGILYRMLTLNTGQTPMSARHQLEILYKDYNNRKFDGYSLIPQVEGRTPNPDQNEFEFKAAIEGFNSYLKRSEAPIDRQEILDNIGLLEKMALEDTSKDAFEEFLNCYNYVFNKLRYLSNDIEFTKERINDGGYEIDYPFGRKATKIFSTSQALCGFGAAIGFLKDKGIIEKFDDIKLSIDKITQINEEWLLNMIVTFETIKNTSKRIGNTQRMYLKYFFRELFNPASDSYLNLLDASKTAYDRVESLS